MKPRILALHLILTLALISCAQPPRKPVSAKVEKIDGKAYVYLPDELRGKVITYFDMNNGAGYRYGETLELVTIDFFSMYFKNITVFSDQGSKAALIDSSVYFFEVESEEKISSRTEVTTPIPLNTIEVRLTVKLVKKKKEIFDSGVPITIFRARKKDAVYGVYAPVAIKSALVDCYHQIMPEIKNFIEKGPPAYRFSP